MSGQVANIRLSDGVVVLRPWRREDAEAVFEAAGRRRVPRP
jgi:hypothetical protein